jgi:carbon storage regulator CsrA
MIGERIIVTVVELDGGRVKIGVEAPREVHIRREELPARPAAAYLELC